MARTTCPGLVQIGDYTRFPGPSPICRSSRCFDHEWKGRYRGTRRAVLPLNAMRCRKKHSGLASARIGLALTRFSIFGPDHFAVGAARARAKTCLRRASNTHTRRQFKKTLGDIRSREKEYRGRMARHLRGWKRVTAVTAFLSLIDVVARRLHDADGVG